MAISLLPRYSSSKHLSKKVLVMQLVIACLLGVLFLFTLKFNVYRRSFVDACTTDRNGCTTGFWTTSASKSNETPASSPPPSSSSSNDSVPKSYAFTIVTAASANHLCSLENFLYSLQHFRSQLTAEEYPRVVVYNIGMNRTQLPVLDQLKDNGLLDELIHFDYTQYPEFWDVSLNAGEYAWKTGIVHEASQRYDGLLLWLDAGNLVTLDFLKNIPSIIRDSGGFWSPRSAYTMRRYTHPGLFRHYGIQPSEYGKKANCNGAAIGFDVDNKTVVDSLILPWYKCGLEKRCIAPPGSSRKNHRQDQAALTLLVYRSGHSCKYPSRMFHQLQIHRDVSCRANLIELDIQNQLFHPSSIDSPQWTENSTIELSYHPEWRFPEGRLTTQELQ